MFRSLALSGLALLPGALAQITQDWESGWDQSTWSIYAPDCNQGGTASLDTTTAHSGKNSMKVAGAGGYCGHIFVGTNTSIPTGDVYVRTWFKATTALTSDHISFIVMPDSGMGAGKHLRFGGMDEILLYNRETDDATLPDLSPNGIATSEGFTAGAWQCLEYHLSPTGTIETWLNSNAIPGLTFAAGSPTANQNGWAKGYKPSITGVYFGWESYGGASNTFWYDDIAISGSRVGCGAGTGTGSGPSTTKSSAPTSAAPTSAAPTTAAPTTAKPTTTTKAPTTMSTSVVSTAAPSSGPTAPKYGQCKYPS